MTLRPFNTFGPRQSTRAVIPQIITQLAAGSRQLKLGALDPTRDFCYVTDTAQAFVDLGEAPASAVLGELFNCGPGDDIADRPARRGHRPVHGRRGRHRRGRPAAAPQGLGGDAAGVRRVEAARAHRVAAALHQGRRACARPSTWFCQPANLARYKANEYHHVSQATTSHAREPTVDRRCAF